MQGTVSGMSIWPAGDWVDFYTGVVLQVVLWLKKQFIPIDPMPLFVEEEFCYSCLPEPVYHDTERERENYNNSGLNIRNQASVIQYWGSS